MHYKDISLSVCMTTYNGEKFIKQQLLSILRQLGNNDEVVISDDSSTDRTIEIVESFNDDRIKILKNNKFQSPIYNLENALLHAKNEYIFLADQDDIWHSDKVNTTLKYLTHYNTVVSDCMLINENGKIINDSFYHINKSKQGLLFNIINNSYLGCCMAFDRKILEASLPFPKKIAMHDIWIGLISELLGKPKFITEKLIYYRRHQSNFSPTSEKSRFNLIYKIKYRIWFIYKVVFRYLQIKFK